ncbi:TPA: DNA cytosine methyltransferase, partial [Pasteurella multocida]|nr:DNA cytosine methyltransferase [Pasteurella multocida]
LLDGDFYNIYPILTNSYNFGIPQKRERVIIIGVLNRKIDINNFIDMSKNNLIIKHPDFFDKVTIKDALSNLPFPNESGEVNILEYNCKYQKYLKGIGNKTFNHSSTKHSSKAVDRIKQLEADQNFKSLDEQINSIHSGSYGRLNYSGVSNTITTRFDTPSGGKFIHPEYNRTLTPREAARIQSFPDDFHFIGSKTSVCKQIGNAVPVKIAYFYANVAKDILHEHFK